MLTRRDSPFPHEAARNLLRLLRAMYALERSGRQRPDRLAAIASRALELQQAVDMALENVRGSLGHAAAWNRAEAVAECMGELCDMTTALEPVLDAAAARIQSAAGDNLREAKRLARIGRGVMSHDGNTPLA